MKGQYKRTKDAIPDDEYATEVLVDAVTVDSVVNSMVTRGVENVLQWTYLVNHLCDRQQYKHKHIISGQDLRMGKFGLHNQDIHIFVHPHNEQAVHRLAWIGLD